MAAFRTGVVKEIRTSSDTIVEFSVQLGDESVEAVAFPRMIGVVAIGDRVVLNTTGIELELGTGGVAFALWNLDGPGEVDPGPGHIVKMRYTPWQTEVMAAEAPESPHHQVLREAERIDGVPVIVCGLHSQLGAACAGILAAAPDTRIGYLMTDAASLPLGWSRQVRELKAAGLLSVTCTAGHAFGGDLEAVNVYSGLAALVHAGRADAVIVAMGPGVVGTGTTLGFTAIEQGWILDAVTALGGVSIAALRISFVDLRERHLGVSHHTLTALMTAARERSTVVIPLLPEDRRQEVAGQLRAAGIYEKHEVVEVDGADALRLLAERGIRPSSMGRPMDDAPDLFVAAGSAGVHAASFLPT
jgi:hypothetical protein